MNSSRISHFFFWAALCLLAICIVPAIYMPPSFGYENGPVEMAQNLLFLIGFIASIAFFRKSSFAQRGIWIFASTMFFIAFWRELSWGAAIPPLFDSSIDPNHVSSHTLWYRPIVTPLIVVIALIGVVSLIRSKSWTLIGPVIRAKGFPLRELCMIVVASLVGTAAEGKMGLSLGLDYDASRTMEELAELCAYMFLAAAALRVRGALASTNDLPTK